MASGYEIPQYMTPLRTDSPGPQTESPPNESRAIFQVPEQLQYESTDTLPLIPHSRGFTHDTGKFSLSSATIVAQPDVPSSAEKGNVGWENYAEGDLPEKKQRKWVRNMRFIGLNIYRRLFTLCFCINIFILIGIVANGGTTTPHIATIVIGNVFASVVIRNDHVVNTLFYIFTSIPKTAPLWVRKTVARVYNLGGIHSGSAVAATMWVIYLNVNMTIDLVHGRVSVALAVVTYVILALMLLIVGLAMPTFRRMHHNSFEFVHRFLGWTAVALVWAQTILLLRDFKPPGQKLHVAMCESWAFALVVLLTYSIAMPWFGLRKVMVTPTRLSKHALQMSFKYVTPTPGSFVRVSRSPLSEWHSFATIAVPGQEGYSMIISRAGDWTSDIINDPPTEIWVRGIPTFGVMNIVPLFKRLVIVATGSGIAPCAPHVFAKKTTIKLLWTSRNIRKTYGDDFVDALMDAAPDAIIYDTDSRGRPDMVKLIHRVYTDFDAEAVCIIANQPITQKVVYGLMTRGVPAFGAIWDS